MSSPPSISTATSPSPSSTGADLNPGGGSLLSSQASLYLYTFLVTLILLLSVSGAIVVRSYIMRRRHRLLVEEAIRNGTYVAPESAKKKKLGEKPLLYDTYLQGGDVRWDPDKSRDITSMPQGDDLQWRDISPLSVLLPNLNQPSDQDGEEARTLVPSSSTPGITPHELPRRFPLRFVHLPAIISDRIRGSANLRPTVASETSPSTRSPTALSKHPNMDPASNETPLIARITVVIAMPSPPFPMPHPPKATPPPVSVRTPGGILSIQPEARSSAVIPHIEFGIADVTLRRFDDLDSVGEKQ